MSGRARGALLVIASALGFATFPIFIRLVFASGAGVYSMLLIRFGLAAALMWPLALLRGERPPTRPWLFALLGMGVIGYFGQSLSYALAQNHGSPAFIALTFYIYPAVVTLLDALINRVSLTRLKLLALGLALVGCALTAGGEVRGSALALLFALLAVVIYSIYILIGNRVMPHSKPLISSAIIQTGAVISFGACVLATGWQPPGTAAGWLANLAMAVIATVLPMACFFAGLSRVGPSVTSMLSTFEPLGTLLLAALVLGESAGPLQLLGGMLILASALLLARGE